VVRRIIILETGEALISNQTRQAQLRLWPRLVIDKEHGVMETHGVEGARTGRRGTLGCTLKLLWQESMTADLGLAPRISVERCMEGSRKH
jgi:hypothetical protein